MDPVEPESWYNKEKSTDKNGVDGLDFVENDENAESDLTHVCDFVEPPTFSLCIYKSQLGTPPP